MQLHPRCYVAFKDGYNLFFQIGFKFPNYKHNYIHLSIITK